MHIFHKRWYLCNSLFHWLTLDSYNNKYIFKILIYFDTFIRRTVQFCTDELDLWSIKFFEKGDMIRRRRKKWNLLFFDLSWSASSIKRLCNMCFLVFFKGRLFYYFAKTDERWSFSIQYAAKIWFIQIKIFGIFFVWKITSSIHETYSMWMT